MYYKSAHCDKFIIDKKLYKFFTIIRFKVMDLCNQQNKYKFKPPPLSHHLRNSMLIFDSLEIKNTHILDSFVGDL